jgi:peroxiredoxin
MTIKVGDKFPSGTFGVMRNGAPAEISTDEVFKGQTVVICGVPGAFTGTCNARHLPGYVDLADKFREQGAKVACLATNDAFVMDAWMKMRNAEGKVMPLSDGDASLLKQMGLIWDTGKFGGVRAMRFSMIVQDGVVKALNVEQGGAFTEKSAADTALVQLKNLK